MRLLESNDDSEFSLTEEFGGDIPRYAILSHTWGPDTEEVTFRDLMDGTGKTKAGYNKIRFCGERARCDGLQYFWVDTCCIDKSNSTELAKAINSMFRWYRNATKCYVYLVDVSTNDYNQVDPSLQSWQSAFRESRWFTRGWTLQELIAPPFVEFFCSSGKRLGDKKSLERQLHEITGIAVPALQGAALSGFSVKERISWAETRETKHEEDKAYSLLGIFDTHMPLIYGERAEGAFERLQDEIHKRRKKRQRDELSVISQAPFNSTKRLKTPCIQSSSVSSNRHPSLIDPELPFDYEYSMHYNNPQEIQKEPVTRVNQSIDATTKQSLIDQLYFTKIDERLTGLTAAQGTTCRWFLTIHKYKSWHDVAQQPDHGGFLWIKGNPGTGKSTLIKLLFEEAKLNAKGDSLQITLSFFFLARGTVEEKSTTGLYRSLLHQLFEKAVELRDSLEWITADGARVIQRNGWHEEALKQTLKYTIQKLRSRSLMIFVDALDECDKNQAAGMLCFFEELCDRAREVQVQLQICFSSRHYPTIVIQKGIEVTLEEETGHIEDIKQYIRSKLRLGKSKQAEALRSEILEKSSGIFLWVVLVVDILNSEYPGSSIKKIRERLKDIPPKLAELFEMILTRYKENLERLHVCLKWILFAARPLKPQELYFAVHLSLDKECSSYWDQEDIDLDQIKTFVRRSSKGLAEVTRNKAAEVQFIHESVRDFLLGKYEGQWSGISGNFVGHGHEILRDCCLAQLNALISQDVNILDPLLQRSNAGELREAISLKFPFLEYSVINVLYHANGAQQYAIEQAGFLAEFPLQRWVFLNNTLEKFKIRRYTKSVSILYILAEKNLADLIRINPQRESSFDVEDERYGLPFLAALITESSEAISAFLDIKAHSQPLVSPLYDLCKRYCQNRKKWTNFGRSFHFSPGRSISSYASEYGDEILLALLIELGECMPDSKDKDSRTLLHWASGNGHVEVVKLLLEKGADTTAADNNGLAPLYQASGNGHVEVVKLLLENGVDTTAADNNGFTPLYHASRNGHVEVVKLLLEKGVDPMAANESRWTALHLASGKGHVEVVKLLLENGVDTTAADKNGTTPLYLASENGHVEVVKLLLENGADTTAADNNGLAPLHQASGKGHVEVVKLLLENGADTTAATDSEWTPLYMASWGGYVEVVKLLLENGADATAVTSRGWTALYQASGSGHVEVVKLLLEKGVDPMAADKSGWTALHQASGNGHVEMVKLLLENGADMIAVTNGRWTALHKASEKGHVEVVKLLLENGADTTAATDSGLTLLHLASEKGHVEVVKLLLENGVDTIAVTMSGWTALYHASWSGHVEVVKLLLENGADTIAVTSSGWTALHKASEKGHVEVVKLLLENGADATAATSNGLTPLHKASEKGHVKVVKLLLEKGADATAVTSNGLTPLHKASEKGHVEVVKLLS